jgi:site-specific DNA-methyltransferase (adenine-specific)
MIDVNKIYNEDCLEGMKRIEDRSIDLILCDLPYGTSASSWDKTLPMEKLWEQYERIIKPNRAIVLFSQEPFTSLLVCSNLKMWKYNWIWEKDNATNFLNSHYQPMKITEDICVFGTGATSYTKKSETMIYNPQFSEGKPYVIVSGQQKSNSAVVRAGKSSGREDIGGYKSESDGKRYPKNLIKFNRDKEKLHPTQKPVTLIEYLIKTYSNEGDLVLDNCMGSGTTAVASINTNRKYIGFEKDEEYYNIAIKRVEGVLMGDSLF